MIAFVAVALVTGCAATSSAPEAEPESRSPVGARSERLASDGEDPAATGGEGPVLVELFTSQGCSSCPPADALLLELGARADVIALAYHVDYWNYIGWSDPFSSSQWSERQRGYARAGDWRVYTPQLVIDGRAHVVGSRARDVERELDAARSRAGARAVVSVRAERVESSESGTGRALVVHVETKGAPGELRVAVYQRGARTAVTRGENTGRTLREGHIVRVLRDLGPAGGSVDASIDVAEGWGDDLGVAAFVQDPESLAILGAASADVEAGP